MQHLQYKHDDHLDKNYKRSTLKQHSIQFKTKANKNEWCKPFQRLQL